MVFSPRGIIPALVTPFRDDESLDEDGLRGIVGFVLEAGVHGVFVAGSQGESYALSSDERRRILRIVVEEVNGRVPVYAGTGAVTTAECVRLTREAAELEAAAASIITPYFIKPTQAELIEHYRRIAQAVDLPIVLYNHPLRTGVHLETSTVKTLAQMENIVGIKNSGTDLAQTMDYLLACDESFSVLSGYDAVIFPTLMMGGSGAVTACGNVVPRLVVDLYEAVQMGDYARAQEMQFKLFPLRKAFALATFPSVIKEAMNLLGHRAGPTRAPVGRLDDDGTESLRQILRGLGVISSRD